MGNRAIFINGVHEHNYKQEGNKHTLYYSLSAEWSEHCRGKVCFEIEETADGFKLPSTEIDSSEAEYLQILLACADRKFKRKITIGKIKKL